MKASSVRKAGLATLAPLALTVAGCGTAESSRPEPEQTVALNWHEAAGQPGNRLVVDVRRFVVRPNGWAVSASVKNDTRATLVISRRHRRHGTECGILLLGRKPACNPDGRPGSLCLALHAGFACEPAARSELVGTFAGAGRLPAGKYVITNHVFLLPTR